MSLSDELQTVQGVGEATADEILSVLEESETVQLGTSDDELVREAYQYLRQNKTREARRRLEAWL